MNKTLVRMNKLTQNLKPDLSDFLAAEIVVVDSTGAIAHVNRKWEETAKIGMLSPRQGWNYIAECEAAIRRGCGGVIEILGGLRAVLNGGLPFYVSTYPCPYNGWQHWYEVLISGCEFDGQRYAVVMHVDVSTLLRDGLTGLPNRTMFNAQLDLVLSLASNKGNRTGVIIVDMDKLKLTNDRYGHRVGDEALTALAAEIKRAAGPDCLVARIGGDEFGVVLPPDYDTLSAWRMLARFESGLACSIGDARNPIPVAASAGIALYPDDGVTASALLEAADKSMYARKRNSSVA